MIIWYIVYVVCLVCLSGELYIVLKFIFVDFKWIFRVWVCCLFKFVSVVDGFFFVINLGLVFMEVLVCLIKWIFV